MKKYFWMLLAAMTLSLGFVACGDDKDDPEPNEQKDPQNQDEQKPDDQKIINFDDCASTIDMPLQQMLQKYGEPTMNFGNVYFYSYEEGNITNLMIKVNQENNKVCMIVQSLKENAYKAEDLKKYFDSKYNFYKKEVIPADEEEGTPEYEVLAYGNTKNPEEATLLIELSGNTDVTYVNPQNQPEEQVSESYFDEMNPADVLAAFFGVPVAEIQEEYEDAFMDMGGMLMASCGDNEWMTSIALQANENGVVTSIIMFFDDGLEEQAILDYFHENGWEIREKGMIDGEDYEYMEYEFRKGNFVINYGDYIATATLAI